MRLIIRLISVILALALMLSLCACGSTNEENTVKHDSDGNQNSSVTTNVEEHVTEITDPDESDETDKTSDSEQPSIGVTEFTDNPNPSTQKTNRETAGFNAVYQMNYVSINCENIMQEKIGLPFGCEVVSLAIVLKYLGYEIDPMTLYKEYMPKGKWGKVNPYYAYVGNPWDRTGYGCYAPCVVTTANDYLTEENSARKAHNVSGSSMYELLGYVWSGYPVILWGTLNMVPESYVLESWKFDGDVVNWYRHSHCVVICGVQDDNFIICDPMVGKIKYPIKDVEAANKLIYSQAVVIY